MNVDPPLLDWEEILGEVRPRTFPEILEQLIVAAEADRERLRALDLPSELDRLDEVTKRRAVGRPDVDGVPFSTDVVGLIRQILHGIRSYAARNVVSVEEIPEVRS